MWVLHLMLGAPCNSLSGVPCWLRKGTEGHLGAWLCNGVSHLGPQNL